LQRTNQKSDQERDAIETLLFMSSPGNSNNMNHTFPPPGRASSQQSPLRAEFGAPLGGGEGRGLDFGPTRSVETSQGRQPGHPATGLAKSKTDLYDIMLDEQDTDSSDGEIEIPITPRRLAAS
jgi:hypothetical protein